MTKKIFILVGAPGSGKTWVANQIKDQYTYVPHDTFGLKKYDEFVRHIKAHAVVSDKPIICDTPFSLTQLQDPLVLDGYEVEPIFVIEKASTTKARYEARDGHDIPKGHLTRIETYKRRAQELRAPVGTSTEILEYMRNHADKERPMPQRPVPGPQHEAHDTQRDNGRDSEPKAEAVQDVRGYDYHALSTGPVGANLWHKD